MKKIDMIHEEEENKTGFIIETIFLQVMLIDVLKSNKIFNSNTEIKK